MKLIALLYLTARRDIRRWQNRRARAKRIVYTWNRWDHMRAVQNNQRRLWQP